MCSSDLCDGLDEQARVEGEDEADGAHLDALGAVLGDERHIVLGTLVITSLVSMVSNILSDFIVSLVDPRIKLGK